MKITRRRLLIIAAIILSVAGASFVTITIVRAGPWEILLGTGTDGGTFYELGEHFADVLEESPQGQIARAKAIETEGSIDNIYRLLRAPHKEGAVELALVTRPALVDLPKNI